MFKINFILFIGLFIINQVRSQTAQSLLTRPSKVLELTNSNYDDSTGKYQIVAINFYADWCPYSARWKPIFHETAHEVYNETSDMDPSTIVFGQINCQEETTLAQRFRVTKYPTTKLTLNGKPLKKEYRGARTTSAFKEYIKKYLADPIVYITNSADLSDKIKENKGAFIIYSGKANEFGDKPIETTEMKIFRRVALQLREDCQFYYITSGASHRTVTPDSYSVVFKPHHKAIGHEIEYTSSLSDFAALAAWAKDQCIPLIREITFDNAEELTEDGLPFVILFYNPNDKTPIEIYKKIVESELVPDASRVTFLIADGNVFSHPLKHLGKTTKDLPVVAIDSFRHLFLYKKPFASISQPGNLKQFVDDLHSGKLDREFHFGPDPPLPGSDQQKQLSPPESAFNKLAPSANRYSLLMPRDEL